MGNRTNVGIEIALSEVIRDFIERALLPFLGLGQPENPTLGIRRGALSAHLLLTAYLHELVHDPTPAVKSIHGGQPSILAGGCLSLQCGNRQGPVPAKATVSAMQHHGSASGALFGIPSISDVHSSEIRRKRRTDPVRNR